MHMGTLPGMTQMVMPLTESTPMTQSLQAPMIPNRIPPVRDVLEPISNEQARADYLKRQMRQMSSISGLPSDIPPLEDITTQRQDNLQKRVQDYCQQKRVKKKQEWESHRMALDRMKEYKEQQRQQQSQEEWDVVYAQMLQEFEQAGAVVRSSISKASTISDEEHRLELTVDDFVSIQWKMDKIDQKLNYLHRNWQAEYKNAVTLEDCNEVKSSINLSWRNMNASIESSIRCSNKQIGRPIIIVYLPLRSIPLILPLVWLPWMMPRH